MKKTTLSLVFIFALAISAFAADLRNFDIAIGATSVTAGDTVALDIVARDTDGATKTDFSGQVAVISSLGEVVVTSTGTTLTGAFSGGIWSGNFKILGAAPSVTITAYDYPTGATGTAEPVAVNAGPYSNLLMIMDGMTWAPGTATGYTGYAVTQTTGITSTFYVTGYACDAYYNTVTASFPRVRLSALLPAGYSSVTPTGTVNLAAEAAANTIFAVSVHPVPDASTTATISFADVDTPSIKSEQTIFFASLTDYFIWADAPLNVRAGEPFSVTVTVSHFVPPSMGGSGAPINGFNEPVDIKAVDNLTRADAPQAISTTPQPWKLLINGVAVFDGLWYEKRAMDLTHAIRIRPADIGTTVMSNAASNSRDSNYIEVFSAEPDNFSTSVAKAKVGKNEQTNLGVMVMDRFYNPVSNTAVTFNVFSGEGTLEAGAQTKTVTAATDFYGMVSVPFSYGSNTKAYISAAVAGVAHHMTMTVETGTILEKSQISNYPNPFNPANPDEAKRKTTVEYYLEADAAVKLRVYSISGSAVWSKEIAAGTAAGGRQGYNAVEWNGMTDINGMVAAGVYILKVEVDAPAGKYTLTRKIAVKK